MFQKITENQQLENPDDDQLLLYSDSFDPEYFNQMNNFRDFVVDFVKEKDFKLGAELGTRSGKLLFSLLKNCPNLKMIAVDSWENNKADDGWMFDHNKNERTVRTEVNKKYRGRVHIIKGYTDKVYQLIDDESLDFVFIDADHSYNSCKKDIELWFPKVKQTGYLMGDDIERALGVKKAVDELLPGWELASPNVWLRSKFL